MSITDELREYIGRRFDMYEQSRTIPIADRIDKEHAKSVERARMDGMDETFGDGWVKLPTDADGVPIHVGDRMAFEDGEEFEVKGFGGSRAERLFYLNENGRFCWGIAENCRHVKPDSWEDVITDALKFAGNGGVPVGARFSDYAEEFVERCRRLAGERG